MPKALEKKLKAKAKKKGLSKEKADAYVYGTLRKTGWKPKKEKIRRAEIGDVYWMVSMLESSKKEYSSRLETNIVFFPGKAIACEVLEEIVSKHIVFVAEKNEQKVAFIAGVAMPHLFNPSLKVLKEIFWCAELKNRKTKLNYRLFKEFLAFGQTFFDLVYFSTHVNRCFSDKLITNLGFKKHEVAYVWGL